MQVFATRPLTRLKGEGAAGAAALRGYDYRVLYENEKPHYTPCIIQPTSPHKRRSQSQEEGGTSFRRLRTRQMSQYWNEGKKGVAYPPVEPRKEHAARAKPMKTRVTEILEIECVPAFSDPPAPCRTGSHELARRRCGAGTRS
jgi:hypothetical protein